MIVKFTYPVCIGLLSMFLLACDSKPTVETREDGLIIQDLVEGTGKEAEINSPVEVHYTGWLSDAEKPESKGDQFDSSLDRDNTFSFVLGLNQVIKGWERGVVGMKEGGKRRLTIPPDLAYGERGAGNVIPPNATLIFDVELVSTDSLEIIDSLFGEGQEAVNGSKVSVHYTGWLYDKNALQNKGKKFDSSVDRGNQFSFVLGARNVISGWDMGVRGMKEGGKRTLIIPAALAYGERGSGGSIPPNSKLIFDIELFAVDTGALQ